MLDVELKFLAKELNSYLLSRTGSPFGQVEIDRSSFQTVEDATIPTYRTPDVYVEEISVFPPRSPRRDRHSGVHRLHRKGGEDRRGRSERQAGQDLLAQGIRELLRPAQGPSGHGHSQRYERRREDRVGRGDEGRAPKLADQYLLYYSVKTFFDNGGGKCYVVSAGTYKAAAPLFKASDLESGVDAVAMEDEPTLLVIPEAVQLSYAE